MVTGYCFTHMKYPMIVPVNQHDHPIESPSYHVLPTLYAIIVPCLSHFPTIIPFKNDGFSWVNPHISRHRKGRNLALALAAHPPGSSTERPSRRWSAAPSIAPRRIATRRAPRAGAQIGCLESIPQGKRGGFFSWENPMENRLIINDDKNCWIVHWTSCF